MKTRSVLLTVALLLLVQTACSGQQQKQPAATANSVHNTLTDAERAAGWRLLFDGSTTAGWRGYMKQSLPAGWQAVDGQLTRVSSGGDIVTTAKYRNFELVLDWKVREGGNSGLFYRAIEGPQEIYYSAPELQLLDDARHRDGRSELTSAGANYGIHPARRGVVKPAGEWNTVRLVVDGNHVEHWLNGEKLVEYELGSSDWKQRVAASKFIEWPEYGAAVEGYVGLQDHGDWVAYRNMKIRLLP